MEPKFAVNLWQEGQTVYMQVTQMDESLRGKGTIVESHGFDVASCDLPELYNTAVYLRGDDTEEDHATASYASNDPTYYSRVRAALLAAGGVVVEGKPGAEPAPTGDPWLFFRYTPTPTDTMPEDQVPEGVEYARNNLPGFRYKAAAMNGLVIVHSKDGPAFVIGTRERDDAAVTILDWPSWVPRPDTRPTWETIVAGAPKPGSLAMFVTGEGVRCVAEIKPGRSGPISNTFMGWLVPA